MTEAIISNSIDLAITGVSNMLLAWGKTGNIKMLTGVAGVPFKLLTRNANVKSIKDFGPNDRIAVPTIRASMQAMMMGIALEQAYGIGPAREGEHPFLHPAVPGHRHEVTAGASRADFDGCARRAGFDHQCVVDAAF